MTRVPDTDHSQPAPPGAMPGAALLEDPRARPAMPRVALIADDEELRRANVPPLKLHGIAMPHRQSQD